MTLYINGVDIGGGRHPAINTSRTVWAGARKVMPLGDSITQGYGSTDLAGYRTELFVASAKLGKPLEYVGTATANGPAASMGFQFPRGHQGIIGYKIADWWNGASGPIDAALAAATPDYICLHIGTNDIPVDPGGAPTRLAALLDRIHAQRAGAIVYLAKIIPSNDDVTTNPLIQTYNASMNAIQAARAAWVTLVDMYAAFTAVPSYKTTLLLDGTHPTDAGYVVMGDTWSATLG